MSETVESSFSDSKLLNRTPTKKPRESTLEITMEQLELSATGEEEEDVVETDIQARESALDQVTRKISRGRLSINKSGGGKEKVRLLSDGQSSVNAIESLIRNSVAAEPTRADGAFRLLTNNVWMLPSFVGKFLSRHRRKRARSIVDCIAKGTTSPNAPNGHAPFDIICLQEVFYHAGRKILTEGLREQGYEVVNHVCPSTNCFVICSGLFFASRFPILYHSSERYTRRATSTADNWAKKGVFGAVLDASECAPNLRLVVFCTHPQAQDEPKVRKIQLEQAREFMRRFVRDSIAMHKKNTNVQARFAVVLCGDLNFDGESTEYFEAMNTLGNPRDLYRELHENSKAKPGNTWNAMPGQSGYLSMRLDYVMAYDKMPAVPEHLQHLRCTYAETLTDAPWASTSDHAPIEVELRVVEPVDE